MTYEQPLDHRALMEEALQELERLERRVRELERERAATVDAPVALVGAGCRFPGGADGLDAYWRLLVDGVDAVSEVPPERWAVDRYYSRDPDAPGTMCTRAGAFIDAVDRFDASFFGIAPREAESMDPQQRILLEVAWEALEHAGLARDRRSGTAGGIFVGITTNDYARLLLADGGLHRLDAYFSAGNTLNAAAGRLAYALGFRGPAMAVDTACSSSLVAVHLACQSLRAGECEIALAAGVNLTLTPEGTIATSRAHMLAPDGRCKTFDASADGYVRGEGCGVVVLKRLADALDDGDPLLGVIRGSAVNQDGASAGLTVPNGTAQEALMRAALKRAGLRARDVHYVEAHGTGTALGDPIELRALARVYGDERAQEQPLRVGSVKTNIGHLESAAGIAGLLKVMLMLRHGVVPPHLHLREPTPHVPWDQLPIAIPTGTPETWPVTDGPRRAAVSAFGFTGTNAHVVLEQAPAREPAQGWEAECHTYPLSARSPAALRALADAHAAALADAAADRETFANMCRSAATGRAHLRHRLAAVGATSAEIRAQLATSANDEGDPPNSGEVDEAPAVAFLFTGQGAQYPGMGRELYHMLPLFRDAIDECVDLARPRLARSLRDVLFAAPNDSDVHRTEYAQPALFAIEYALTRVWERWGITPTVVLGHSLGELVAACVAGVLGVEDGMRIAVERGRLMQGVNPPGTMATAFVGVERVTEVLGRLAGDVVVAAINGPDLTVISGETRAMATACALLDAAGITIRALQTSHAFHSPLMQQVVDPFRALLEDATWALPRIPLVSNVTGRHAGDDVATPEYWCRHLLAPVDFLGGIGTIAGMNCGVHVEIGPAPVLTTMGRRCRTDSDVAWLPSLRPGQSDWRQMQETLARLYTRGAPVDWHGVWDGARARRVELPHYRWQRRSFWVRPVPAGTAAEASEPPLAPLTHLGARLSMPGSTEVRFEATYDARAPRYVRDHRLDHGMVVPAASHVTTILAGARAALGATGVVLEDLVFPHALVLGDDESAQVQLVLRPDVVGGARAEVHGALAGGTSRDWRLHAEGRLHALGPLTSFDGAAMATIDAWRTDRPPDRTGASFYHDFHAAGYTLGPAFSWLDALWSGDGMAVGCLRAPQLDEDPARYPVHPGLLDSCFQLLAQTGGTSDPNVDALLVPFRIARLVFHQQPAEGLLWAYAYREPSDGSGALRGAVRLFADDGAPVVDVEGFEARPWRRSEMASPAHKRVRRAGRFEVRWVAQPPSAPAVATSGRPPFRWLLLGDAEVMTPLATRLRNDGHDVTIAIDGGRLERLGDGRWTFDGTAPDDFDALLAAVDPTGVVHLLTLDQPPATDLAAITAAQRVGSESALLLVQAVLRRDERSPPRLVFVTGGVQAAHPADASVRLEHAPLWALAQVVAAERPELPVTCIDLPADTRGLSGLAGALAAELVIDDGETRVSLRPDQVDGGRLVARLTACAASDMSTVAVRTDGTYLITGGLGALGAHVARWLAARGAGRIALLSRRGADTGTAAGLSAELRAAGSDVLVIAADVADADRLAEVLETLRKGPPLRGVVHAAGVLDDAMLADQSASRFVRVFRSKVNGAWALHTLTTANSLDFMVFFSSASALLGAPGQANYAAANGFLDGLAAYRRLHGLTALSVAWGPWSTAAGGMTGDSRATRARLAAHGVEPLEPADALSALEGLLTSKRAQVAVLSADWSRVAAGAARPMPLLADLLNDAPRGGPAAKLGLLPEELRALTPAARRGRIDLAVRGRVAECLGLELDEVAPRIGFFELGMDSLSAVELRNRLQADLGIAVPATIAFQQPTADALVAWLLAGPLSDPGDVTPAPEPVDAPDERARVAAVAQLSPDELSLLVDHELRRLLA